MIAGNREIGIPENLRVVVSVQIDESRRDDLSVGVDYFRAFVMRDAADLRDAAVFDSDVAAKTWRTGSVHHHSVLYDQIEFRHGGHLI